MTKKLHVLITAIVLLVTFPSYGKLKELKLNLEPSLINENSLYREIDFVDGRSAAEKKALRIDENLFNNQLNGMLPKIEASDTSRSTLIVHLRNLYTEFGDYDQIKCYARISLYEDSPNKEGIFFINTLNTYLPLVDNDRKDEAAISDLLTTFIYTHLTEQPENYSNEYQLNQLSDISKLEKSKIKLYTSDRLTDGIYNNFSSFANQSPQSQISSFKSKDSYIKEVKYIDPKNGKESKVKTKQTFGIVINGNAYIQIKGKYYPLDKDEDNDYITRVQKSKDNTIGMIMAFGVLGAEIIGQSKVDEYITLKLDHLSGELSVKSKEVEIEKSQFFKRKKTKKTIKGNDSMKKW